MRPIAGVLVLLWLVVGRECLLGTDTSTNQPAQLKARWSVLLSGPCDGCPAVARDGTIYVGTFLGDLWALSAQGSRKWIFHAGREIRSSPAIAADGVIYFGSRTRQLYAVSPDGKKKWEFKTGAWVGSS